VADAVPTLNASTVAVVLGALAANLGLHRPVLHPGTHFASSRLLRLAIVLLGLQLALPQLVDVGATGLAIVIATVACTFVGTRLLGRVLGLPPGRSLLVATGFAICGASAIAAMKDATNADEDDAAVSIALVTICGSLAIFLLPLLREPLGLDPSEFGSWVGASVHDVGQTVATADRVDGALATAVVVKLSRVVLLAPLVAWVALSYRRRAMPSNARHRPIVPLFVVGFVLAIAVASTGALSPDVLAAGKLAQHVLLVAALVGLGTGINVKNMRRTGARTLALGLGSWLMVGGIAYAGVSLVS